ncbi:MAG TPA: hypothetical protein VFQ81_07155 [Candidatus Limnocylindria bacterium]|nr:hypothetical protein [Candidatus Limnocylindria bacterium]
MSDGQHRRFRIPILLGCLGMIASGFLPWWHAGGESVNGVQIPPQQGIGLEGPGLVIYGAAVIGLVLLDIGYMRGRWGFVLDAPPVYLLLGLGAAAALAFRTWELWRVGFLPLPQQSPGLAVAAVGVALVLYGAGTGWGARRTY